MSNSKHSYTTTRQVEVPRRRVLLPMERLERPLDEILYGTITKLQRLRQEEPKVALYIEQWCENRQKTLDLVPTLRKIVETICSRCNTARQAGTAASVGGILSVVVGVLLKWKGIPVGDQFLKGGKYLTATGTVVLGTSNLAEACLTLSPTNRIKEVIDNDIELTEPIRMWLEFSHEVEYCFDKLLRCNIASPGFLKVMNVLDNCINLINAGTYEIRDLIQDLRCCKVRGIGNVTVDVSREVIRFLVRIRNNPNIRQPLKEICEIASETPSLIRFVHLGINVYFQTYGIMPNLPFDLKSSNVLYCALDVIKMLHDLVLNIKCEEIEKRQTDYFEALDRVTLALESELNEVKDSLKQREAYDYDYEGYDTVVEEFNNLRVGP